MQCFKLAGLAFFPFGKDVVYGGGAMSLIANVLWMLLSGIPLAIAAVLNGLALCITIIGIPFGLQCFKLAKLALSPFGRHGDICLLTAKRCRSIVICIFLHRGVTWPLARHGSMRTSTPTVFPRDG